MDLYEVADVTVDVLEYAPVLGVQVKTMLCSLALPVGMTLAWKVAKWPVSRWSRRRAEARKVRAERMLEETEIEEDNRSPACEVILRSLDEPNPSYNDATHRLFCGGIMVEFHPTHPRGFFVARILGNPRFEGDKVLGTEVYTLLCAWEQELVRDAAEAVRASTVERDLRRANERAAAEITGAHYREKARQQAHLVNQAGHQPVYVHQTLQQPFWVAENGHFVPTYAPGK